MSLTVTAVMEHAVRVRVTQVVADFLRLNLEQIDPAAPLALYGIDSLSSMQLVAALENAFDRNLPDWFIEEHPDVNSIVQALSDDSSVMRDDELNLMLSDAVLPTEIHPKGKVPNTGQPRHILLTGSTGFLGAYLLRRLLHETEAEIHCLVRTSHGDGLQRIRHNLQRYNLWQESLAGRIHTVSGNLLHPNLGLAAAEHEFLSLELDTIYHAAADVNWVSSYRALRNANVLGTRELIRLACAIRPKTFHFVSSLSVGYAVGGPTTVREDDDMLLWIDHLPLAYAQSKCVAESLLRQAAARGLNVCIYRPALIGGDSQTGASNVDDLLAALLKGCIQMGSAPDLDLVLDVLPVDRVAHSLVRLSQSTGPGLHNLHVSNSRPRHWRELVLWMNLFGYPVTLVPYNKWQESLRHDAASPAHALHHLRNLFLRHFSDGATVPELYQEGRRSVPDCTRTKELETNLGLDYPPLNAELLDRYFSYYIQSGFLKEPSRNKLASSCAHRVPAHFEAAGFFEPLLRHHFRDASLRVADAVLLSTGSENSIIGELTSWRHRQQTGLFRYRLTFEQAAAHRTLEVMAKDKPSDQTVIEVAKTVAELCDPQLGCLFHEFSEQIGMKDSHVRELAIYERADDQMRRYMPICYGTWRDDEYQKWGLALEHLEGMALMDAVDNPEAWSRAHVEAVITGLAGIHAVWYGREAELRTKLWIGHVSSLTSMMKMKPLWQALAAHAAPYFEGWAGPEISTIHRELTESIHQWWPAAECAPRTLIHNDFNPRNVALRHDGTGFRLCAYDWELATIGAPQRDLAEFLCFVLPSHASEPEVSRYVELHRTALGEATGHSIPAAAWREGFRSALADLLISRLSFYAMIHRVRPQRFLPRVVRTWQQLNAISGNQTVGWPD